MIIMPTCVTELYAGILVHDIIAMDGCVAEEQDSKEDQVKDNRGKKKLLAWLRMLMGACMRMF